MIQMQTYLSPCFSRLENSWVERAVNPGKEPRGASLCKSLEFHREKSESNPNGIPRALSSLYISHSYCNNSHSLGIYTYLRYYALRYKMEEQNGPVYTACPDSLRYSDEKPLRDSVLVNQLEESKSLFLRNTVSCDNGGECHPGTPEAEAGGWYIQGQPELYKTISR